MTDNVENIILEHLKRIQAELSAARERDREIIARLGSLEATAARTYAELVERRLELI